MNEGCWKLKQVTKINIAEEFIKRIGATSWTVYALTDDRYGFTFYLSSHTTVKGEDET